jgi:general L-amino acid transport system substrate-binding protein
VGLVGIGLSTGAMAGKDLDAIRARGALNCGVGIGTAGFMLADSQGKWRGLSVDVCRGDAEKVKYVPSPRSSASSPCSREQSTW